MGTQLINHALFIIVPCHDGTFVEPANKTAEHNCTKEKLPNGTPLSTENAPPLGARLRLDMTSQEIDTLPIPDWKKKFVRAMRDYGAFVGDTGNSFYFSIEMESGNQYTSMGNTNRWTDFVDPDHGRNPIDGWVYDASCGTRGGYCPTHWKSTMHNDATKNPNEGTFSWKTVVWSNLVVVDECVPLSDPAKRCI